MNSMTGYGRAEQIISGYNVAVELKSVNHRYFAFSPRVPRVYNYLEGKLKNLVHSDVSRGEVDLYLSVRPVEGTSTVVEIDKALAKSYLDELKALSKELGLENNLKISHMTRFNDVFSLNQAEVDENLIWDIVEQTAKIALENFNKMRMAEGEKLCEDIVTRLANVENLVAEVEKLAPITVDVWQKKLYEKITEVLEDRQIDDSRVVTEVAIFANKVAVDEEVVRLRSHIHQFREIVEEQEPIGRKMDFLVQELNREANTIGSKCQDADSAKIVVEIKSEIEKIREQIQNVE